MERDFLENRKNQEKMEESRKAFMEGRDNKCCIWGWGVVVKTKGEIQDCSNYRIRRDEANVLHPEDLQMEQ